MFIYFIFFLYRILSYQSFDMKFSSLELLGTVILVILLVYPLPLAVYFFLLYLKLS